MALPAAAAVNCRACAGACCESLHLTPAPGELGAWLRTFAARELASGQVEVEVRCSRLTPAGACSVYEERPGICRAFPAGGPQCLEVVRRRRTPEQYAAIREEGDPPAL